MTAAETRRRPGRTVRALDWIARPVGWSILPISLFAGAVAQITPYKWPLWLNTVTVTGFWIGGYIIQWLLGRIVRMLRP